MIFLLFLPPSCPSPPAIMLLENLGVMFTKTWKVWSGFRCEMFFLVVIFSFYCFSLSNSRPSFTFYIKKTQTNFCEVVNTIVSQFSFHSRMQFYEMIIVCSNFPFINLQDLVTNEKTSFVAHVPIPVGCTLLPAVTEIERPSSKMVSCRYSSLKEKIILLVLDL